MRPGSVTILFSVAPLLLSTVCCNKNSQQRSVTSYKIQHRYLNELSGLVVSRKNPHWTWVHNDRGNGPSLFALQEGGKRGIKLKITGAVANDWEDLGSGRDSTGRDWLFIADTGRKKDAKKEKRPAEPRQCVWVIEEPELPQAGQLTQAKKGSEARVPKFTKAKSKKAAKIDLYFPKGAEPDIEALFVLPEVRGLCLVSKKKSGKCRIYRGLFPAGKERSFPAKLELQVLAELEIPGKNATDRRITSACLDAKDAQLFLISRTRLFSFRWPPRSSTKKGAPTRKAAVKPLGSWALPKLQQSEAIDFAANNKELVIVSEGKPAVFLVFPRPNGP